MFRRRPRHPGVRTADATARGGFGASTPSLELRSISATYREKGATFAALEGVSLSVNDGEVVALIGPSGCGKSTLLDVVAGLLIPDAGEVRIRGRPLVAAERLGASAYMRQRDLLLPWRTALGNAALALEVDGTPKRRAMELAGERFPAFGLEGFEDAYPAQLSGGMRQRVAFLRTALAGRPLLLLDEPFGALDALTRAEMQAWLLALLEGGRVAVLLVTHDVEEAVLLADRVIVLTRRPGRVTHEEAVRLTRPRRRTQVMEPAFLRHKAAILAVLGLLDGDTV